MIASISISMQSLGMGQIVIRNIDTAVIEALRRGAAACGTSMEEQARRALTKAVGLDRDAAARRLAEIRRITGLSKGLRRPKICAATEIGMRHDDHPRCQRRAQMCDRRGRIRSRRSAATWRTAGRRRTY